MITEKDLREAIAECRGVRNPNSNTCIKLAAYYTILDHITENKVGQRRYEPVSYSYDSSYSSTSEFSNLIHRKDKNDVLAVMDELMDALRVLNPKLYESVIKKLKKI